MASGTAVLSGEAMGDKVCLGVWKNIASRSDEGEEGAPAEDAWWDATLARSEASLTTCQDIRWKVSAYTGR